MTLSDSLRHASMSILQDCSNMLYNETDQESLDVLAWSPVSAAKLDYTRFFLLFMGLWDSRHVFYRPVFDPKCHERPVHDAGACRDRR